MKTERPQVTVVSFIGRPLAGKDTQAELFQSRYPSIGIAATGNLLRDKEFLSKVAGFSDEKIDSIQSTMKQGGLIPDEIPEELMHDAILQQAREGKTMVILTGHPRTRHQARDLRKWIQEQNKQGEVSITPVNIHFAVRSEKALARRQIRLALLQRVDDTSEKIARDRQKLFEKETWPILRGMWIRSIIGQTPISWVWAGRKEEQVFQQVERVLSPYLPERRTIPQ